MYSGTMALPRTYQMRLADEKKLQLYVADNPVWAQAPDPIQFTPLFLAKAGIMAHSSVIGGAFLKLHYRDFIVEEITGDKRVISIAPNARRGDDEPTPITKPKVKFELVKQGIATNEALELIAETSGIALDKFRHAGLKDSRAITAQEIVVIDARPENFENLVIPNIFLKNIHSVSEVLDKGHASGNRFTILLRTPTVNDTLLRQRITLIQSKGFLNFFSLQRFGSRLMSHKYGELILKQHYEQAVKLFLCGDSEHEWPLLQYHRKQALAHWGDWQRMRQEYDQFPYFFYYERLLLEALEHSNGDIAVGLTAISDQTQMWTYAYFSYWFNRLLSHKSEQSELPDELPLLRSDAQSQAMYDAVMSLEDRQGVRFSHPQLRFLTYRSQFIPSRIMPKVHSVVHLPEGYLFHFDLDKGAYATTFLSQLFSLYQGRPAPEWVSEAVLETRQLLGYQPLEETEASFPPKEDDSLVSDL